ncbi:MAG: hypothetical protein ACD_40C00191G0003 [uncultured bacterium]|nr:MAG: hypothetical protein ACD_40C00191G0003 [uncultured bacterium]KKU15399.1 MAG: hypothetical protein UX21_C0003G0020 [Microgenomates group bacterium GW2011_GWC2_45_8]KKU26223.1 MAG: hypothetical protein UX37_C0004G0018 [Microgenomates group bacterium GW2011_GWA2_46_16]
MLMVSVLLVLLLGELARDLIQIGKIKTALYIVQ